MSEVSALNTSLYRTLKSGSNYNRFFSKTSCKATYVGSGVTSFGLQKMKEVTLKHKNQTEKIAKVLKGKNIPETVLNIKNFLYDHLQYSADGWEQNLRTPNCSWQTRKTGIDCKSYSVFAMSILLNLKIPKVSFRKITQPNSPNKWSHVYVVVVYKGKELIIDATVPYNYEVAKVKKEDLNMESKLPYNVLNGAATPTLVNKKTFDIATALNNFQDWLDELEINGVSKQVTDTIWYEVKSYVEKGIEPQLNITENSITIGNKKIDYFLNGLGEPVTASLIIKGVTSIFSSGALSDIFGGKESVESVVDRTHAAIIGPMKAYIENKLTTANASNVHLAATDIDKYLNVYIKNEEYWRDRVKSASSKAGSNEVIARFKELLTNLRAKFSPFGFTQQTGTFSYKNFKNNKQMKYPISYYNYSVANTNSQNFGIDTGGAYTPTGSNNVPQKTNSLQDLVNTANGLFVDKTTGKTYTPQEVQNLRTQNAQGGGLPQANNQAGLSTGAKIGIGVGALALIGGIAYVAIKK